MRIRTVVAAAALAAISTIGAGAAANADPSIFEHRPFVDVARPIDLILGSHASGTQTPDESGTAVTEEDE
ncbi:hypothetical protein SAMN05421805_10455 [Saccharopolyspora antimicrobica]|uniref:Uncharacterized protein n=1 Tax=Saccharopolyspora antimicrobica TaxID=455193 RepID=A0A1I4YAG6_9PSEU|nr:hypothetical protein [Saccharopolyspora antimicrobica]RKT82588.1 hypothetical protein ATL45_0840 [Saccharopolyspora antimicrobica]SFN34988.1 hypothetical protein SAMN05421805_10455 [Saccharopolyspora antimicrobica]